MRRHLGLSVEDAEQRMPWWERRMLLEQLIEDKPWITYAVSVEMPEDDEPDAVPLGGDLSALGFNVRQVG